MASPAGDKFRDVVGVVGLRAGLAGAARRTKLVEEPGVLDGELGPLLRHVVFVEDRLHRADRLPGPPVDAFAGVEVGPPLPLVDAADRALLDAGLALAVVARPGDHV